jgi:hypothetical protein
MLKKVFLITMMCLLMIGMVSAVSDTYLTASLTKYDPQPAEPGKYINVFIQLENTGIDTAENVELQLIENFPFSLDPGKSNIKQIGLLGGKDFHTVEFKIKVDEKAVEGDNVLKVRYNQNPEKTVWGQAELEISVQTQDALLSIEKIQTTPTEIAPGETGTITIDLKNLADSHLSDVIVSLDLSSETLPFAPFNSASEKSIYQINPDEIKEFAFDVIAYPNAVAGIYKIPLTITYSDNVGSDYTKTDVIGVLINDEPDIQVVTDSTNLLSEKRTGSIILKIINKGLTDVKFMSLKIGETDEFEILSTSKTEYIGNLDSDDFETVEFNILVKSTEDIIEIPLELEYRNNNNKLYTQDLSLNLKIHSASALGISNSGSGWTIIIIIILIIAGIIVYRKVRKIRKKNKQK